MFASETGEILVIGMFVLQAATEQNIQHLMEMNSLMQITDCISSFLVIKNIEQGKWKFFPEQRWHCALCVGLYVHDCAAQKQEIDD